jgi:hypothetical protein
MSEKVRRLPCCSTTPSWAPAARGAARARRADCPRGGCCPASTREMLQKVGADVLVVNLDDSADDALDHLYELIDGDTPAGGFQ